jgi:SAM-dependent methyltransferase
VDFDALVQAAVDARFEGWDFSWLEGRGHEDLPPWDYRREAAGALRAAATALDVDTGGGEVLASLPLPPFTVATEGYAPNVPVAASRLRPLGVHVVEVGSAPDNVDQSTTVTPASTGTHLPFAGGTFDVIVNRHASYWPAELARVLRPGGAFLTQQRWVGGAALEREFGRMPESGSAFTLAFAVEQLETERFETVRAEEVETPMRFSDVGALVYYLRAVPWVLPGFDPVADRETLRRLHDRMEAGAPFAIEGTHILIGATSAGY